MLQKTALDILKTGRNVALFGSAGTGKSYTIKQYIDWLTKNKVKFSQIAVTATTGIAATNIEGVTIHSFSCIGVKDEMTDKEITTLLLKRKKRVEAMLATKVLIIDEISMFHRKQLELADKIMRIARKDSRPFGGVQVVVVGDFFQLPPVSKNNKEADLNRERFCFMSPIWAECGFTTCYLSEQFRTSSYELNSVLNAIRESRIEEEHLEILRSRMIKPPSDQILNLYSHNENVDLINFTQLNKLKTETFRFTAETDGNEFNIKTLLNSITAPQNLELKVGAKVMFVKNNPDDGYANGTQGEIIKFIKDEEYNPPYIPVVKTVKGDIIQAIPVTWEYEEKGQVVATVKQIPLRLAWAITIHKSQGMSLDQANINLSRVFELGAGFVALSRLKTLDGLYIEDFKENSLELNPLAKKADARFLELSSEAQQEYENLSEKELQDLHKSFLKQLLR